ncbi:uncharacterized protein MONBRDRAFT_36502 [Monosiga brevicollis MX1]|uniref:Uncharacterized protein n=1 Tax=Monosiga brevicollis TaxID=81824 RepID=A9UVL8_MONBE|nr:uncharacterized protein MONBRDRAFT_36502 [Monosiga brevicollis MX1]EDQ90418.1 predicted protein [Monosiga brevicollis MX1]|eukprot:XP_001744469.1 hypothetical protein [Monosiga brevicollis MX1]
MGNSASQGAKRAYPQAQAAAKQAAEVLQQAPKQAAQRSQPATTAGARKTQEQSLPENMAAQAAREEEKHCRTAVPQPGEVEDSTTFLETVKQIYVASQDVQSNLPADELAQQAVAHRTKPTDRQLDRARERLPASERADDVVEGRLNFQQLQNVLRLDLATRPSSDLTKVAQNLKVSEDDIRRIVYYYRLPVRPQQQEA